jgi:hypothetical protein
MRKTILAAIALATLAPIGAYAGEEQQQSPAQKPQAPLICRTVEETGSRLKARKVCMTGEQWADQRRQDRMMIERSQMNACTPGANC